MQNQKELEIELSSLKKELKKALKKEINYDPSDDCGLHSTTIKAVIETVEGKLNQLIYDKKSEAEKKQIEMETHQPQQILVRVDCKETEDLPVYEVLCEDIVGEKLFGYLNLSQLNGYVCESEETLLRDVIAWYEPATAIVLTVEEYEKLKQN